MAIIKMELLRSEFFMLDVVSELSKLRLGRGACFGLIPSTLYFDCYVKANELPGSLAYRSISTLAYISCAGRNLIEGIQQDRRALKCFEESGKSIYYIYYLEHPAGTLVLAQITFFELSAELGLFQKELAALAQERVKDIRFKCCLKDSAGYYKAYFDQWVELVNSQQREISRLTDDLKNFQETEDTKIDAQGLSKCLICEKDQRKVVFVPCGHVLVCLNCLNNKMNIKPSTLTGKKAMKCISCKRRIKIAHEVYY